MLIFVRLRTIYFFAVHLLPLRVLQVELLNTGWWIWKNLERNDHGPVWGVTQAFGWRDKKNPRYIMLLSGHDSKSAPSKYKQQMPAQTTWKLLVWRVVPTGRGLYVELFVDLLND